MLPSPQPSPVDGRGTRWPSPPPSPGHGRGTGRSLPGRTRGLTLMELMMTLTLVAIIAGLGAPSFREIALNARRSEQVNALLRALHLARSAAILRAEPVVICKTGGRRECADRCERLE